VVVPGSPLVQEVAEFDITFVLVPKLEQLPVDWQAVFWVLGPKKPPAEFTH